MLSLVMLAETTSSGRDRVLLRCIAQVVLLAVKERQGVFLIPFRRGILRNGLFGSVVSRHIAILASAFSKLATTTPPFIGVVHASRAGPSMFLSAAHLTAPAYAEDAWIRLSLDHSLQHHFTSTMPPTSSPTPRPTPAPTDLLPVVYRRGRNGQKKLSTEVDSNNFTCTHFPLPCKKNVN